MPITKLPLTQAAAARIIAFRQCKSASLTATAPQKPHEGGGGPQQQHPVQKHSLVKVAAPISGGILLAQQHSNEV
jgi:hypothetical protein